MFCAILISVGVFYLFCVLFFCFSGKGLHGHIHWEMLHTVVSSRKFTTHVKDSENFEKSNGKRMFKFV